MRVVTVRMSMVRAGPRKPSGLAGPGGGMGRMAGDLARQNAMRNPRRTAATASSLMIGMTMVATMGGFATSLKASFADPHADPLPGRGLISR